MTRHQLGVLLCRVLALFMLYVAVATTVAYSPTLIERFSDDAPDVFRANGYELQTETNTIRFFAGAIAVPWTLAAVFWFGAGWLSRRMVSDGPLPGVPETLDAPAMLSVAMVVLGLVWLMAGVQGLVRPPLAGGPGLPGDLAYVAAGLWLVLGVKGNLRLLGKLRDGVGWLRTAGTDKEDPRRSASDRD